MRTTDSSGRPLRYVPRQRDPLRDPPRGTTDLPGPLPMPRLPTLPGEAVDKESLYALVNAIRTLLLAAGLAVEEKV